MENKLNFLVVCENAILADISKNLSLINIFDVINTIGFPTMFPKFSVVFGLVCQNEGGHEATLAFSKNGSGLVEIKIPFTGKSFRSIQNFANFKFLEEGEYVFEIKLDNMLLGSTSLFLKKSS